MTFYRLKNPVLAIQYTGQLVKALPDWVWNYKGFDPNNGHIGVSRTLDGTLLIPSATGFFKAQNGDWLVFEDDVLLTLSNARFEKRYVGQPEDMITFSAMPGSELAAIAPTLEAVGPAPVTAADVPIPATIATGEKIIPAPVTAADVPTPVVAAPTEDTITSSDASEG